MAAQTLQFKTSNEFLKYLKDNEVNFVDCNFTDMRGKWHHMSEHVSCFDKGKIEDGICFDGSSLSGWKAINDSDMVLKPDLSKVVHDPFSAQKTVKIFCDIHDPLTGKNYNRDPRSIAKAAEAFLKKSGVGDTAIFGPEAEFFVFDDVRVETEAHNTGYSLDSAEGPYNTGREYPDGNMGHRPGPKGGYVPEAPVDSLSDIRAEMMSVMQIMGLTVEKHHHEVAPSQHEIGMKYSTLVDCADNTQVYKHVVHNVANSYGKSATFMPKPIYGDNGSGMHCHQSIWKGSKPTFAGDAYAGLSETALYYVGGIIKHAKAINAFTNPSTNSYKRLVPGYEAPVLLAYSARNRSASCRIPHSVGEAGKRVEVRFPDATANPYLAFAAMLMAGLDGIENKIHPGESMDVDLYELPKDELAQIPHVAGSLQEALDSLAADHEFLLKGDVFTADFIEAYIDLKTEEVDEIRLRPHPAEFKMYYSS